MTKSEQEKERQQDQSQGKTPTAEIPVPEDLAQRGLPFPSSGKDEPDELDSPVVDRASEPVLEGWPERTRFAQDVHTYLREHIRLADQKAIFFFAGGTTLLAFLYKNGAVDLWLKPLMSWNILDVVSFIAIVSLMLSVLLAVWVVIPRTGGARRGRIFWEAIGEYRSAREYADDLVSLTGHSLIQVRAEHCWDLAKVCKAKYRVLRVALTAGAVGLAASLVIFLFL